MRSMRCPARGFENPSGKFCGECGVSLKVQVFKAEAKEHRHDQGILPLRWSAVRD
jgi:hypothetical protein